MSTDLAYYCQRLLDIWQLVKCLVVVVNDKFDCLVGQGEKTKELFFVQPIWKIGCLGWQVDDKVVKPCDDEIVSILQK